MGKEENRIYLLDHFIINFGEVKDFDHILKKWDDVYFRFIKNTKNDRSVTRQYLEDFIKNNKLSRETTYNFFVTENQSRTVLLTRESLFFYKNSSDKQFFRIKGADFWFEFSKYLKIPINNEDIELISLTNTIQNGKVVIGLWTVKSYEEISALLAF